MKAEAPVSQELEEAMTTEAAATGNGKSPLAGRVDAVVVGAGFSGLYMMYKLKEMGFSAIGFERGPDVGGTWYHNRYPGCQCDIESMQYSYQFSKDLQQEWNWPERFASQPDILEYIRHVADRFELREQFRFNTSVSAATFDEDANEWEVATDSGEVFRSWFLILGVGCLSSTNIPPFKGLDDFEGDIFHTGAWPSQPVDFSGKRVGIIGTGSSGIQIIPLVAKQAEHLTIFQRTPNYVIPARNRQLASDEVAAIKSTYDQYRALAKKSPQAFVAPVHDDSAADLAPEERLRRLEHHWNIGGLAIMGAFGDTISNESTNKIVADFWRDKIRSIVKDQKVAEALLPRDAVGCKRICSGTNYYETFNRENVALIGRQCRTNRAICEERHCSGR